MGLTQLSLSLADSTLFALAACVPPYAVPIKNVVIVHGVLADGSGWRNVHDLLDRQGLEGATADDLFAG